MAVAPMPVFDTTPAIWSLATDVDRREFVEVIGLETFWNYASDEQRNKLQRMLARQKQSNQQMR